MRIVVDTMPKDRESCPYCRNKSAMNMSDYRCAYNTTDLSYNSCCCYEDDMTLCPYFVSLANALRSEECSDIIEELMEDKFEKIPYDNRY